MAELLGYGNREDEGGHASPVGSGSADWELISSSPSSPLPQSRDDVFGLEEFEVRTLSILGSVFESSGLLQDDYFAYGRDKSDLVPIPMVMGGNVARSDEAGSSLVDSDGSENSQKSSFPLPVLADLDCIDPSLSHVEVAKKDEAIASLAFEWRSTASNISIETGVPLTKRFSRGDSAPELCPVSEPTTFYINPRFPDAPWYDTQVNVRRIEHCYYDCGRSKRVDDGGSPVAAHDSEAFGSILSEGIGLDAVERSKSNEGGRGFVWDSWIVRQLSLWQTQLARANSVWSLALAAAAMGLLIVGRGWQRLQAQNRNLRLQLRAKDKKITQLMCQVIHMKDSRSKSRGKSMIRVNTSLQIPQDRQ